MQYRDLTPEECRHARTLLETVGLDDQVHHFMHAMTESDFDEWERTAQTHRMIGCFDHGCLVGFAQIAPNAEQSECSLFVTADHRKQGIGTALFQHACEVARTQGAHFLTILATRGDAQMLDLAARNEGLSIYRHGKSMILPGEDHANARWLAFDLDAMPAETWFKRTLQQAREHLKL